MQHNFKVGDKVKVKPYDEFDFSGELYDFCQVEVRAIADGVFEILDIDKDGDLCLKKNKLIDYNFFVHPSEVTPVSTKKPRPHAELIKQWADDDTVEIQEYNSDYKRWINVYPHWYPDTEYRIKPKTVTKRKWAYGTSMNSVVVTGMYYTEEEFCTEYKTPHNRHKLEWTAKEFEI